MKNLTPDWQLLSALDIGDDGNEKHMVIRRIFIIAWPQVTLYNRQQDPESGRLHLLFKKLQRF